MLADLSAGRVTEDPFPEHQTQRFREYLRRLTGQYAMALGPGEVAQAQPMDMLLLGALLRGMGDPDAEILKEYAIGVPIGVGVDLPRTPEVFPAKTAWSLKGQKEFGGSVTAEEEFRGKDMG